MSFLLYSKFFYLHLIIKFKTVIALHELLLTCNTFVLKEIFVKNQKPDLELEFSSRSVKKNLKKELLNLKLSYKNIKFKTITNFLKQKQTSSFPRGTSVRQLNKVSTITGF